MIFPRRRIVFAALCLLLLSAAVAKAAVPQLKIHHHPPLTAQLPETVYDGTAFAFILTGKGLQAATVSFLDKTVTATAGDTVASASGGARIAVLLPVPLDRKKGPHEVAWTATLSDGSSLRGASPVAVRNRRYPVQKLSVEPKYVTPDPALTERIAKERKLMGEAIATRSEKRRWPIPGDTPMPRPVSGKVTSMFGLRRVLNEQPRGRHKGVDFRGAAGTPVKAVADGVVVLTGDFYYPGMFVIIDHGLGVVSTSMHLSEIVAVQGQEVKAGETIGRIGSTGRSTGPHLHLSLAVLGESVDALPLLAMTAEDKALYAPPTAAKKNTGKRTGKTDAGKSAPAKQAKKPAGKAQ